MRGGLSSAVQAGVSGSMAPILQLTEMRLRCENADAERQYYYLKLRDLEELCQSDELAHEPVRAAALPSILLCRGGSLGRLWPTYPCRGLPCREGH